MFLFLASSLLTAHPYFTYDSFDYMALSLKPVVGATHPLAFGFYLKALADLGKILSIPTFGIRAFMAIQTIIASIIFWFFIKGGKDFIRSARVPIALLYCSGLLLLSLSLLMLKNAVWTETIFSGFFILITVFFGKIVRFEYSSRMEKILSLSIAWGLLVFLSYELRYQASVYLAAGLCTLIMLSIRRRILLKNLILIIAAFLSSFFGASQFTKFVLPKKTDSVMLMNQNINISLMCHLRCNSILLAKACQDTELVKKVQTINCSNAINGFESFPATFDPALDSIQVSLRREGLINSLSWLLFSPISYLTHQHYIWGLEIGRFRFLDDDGVKAFKDVGPYFTDQFDDPRGHMNRSISFLQRIIWFLHFKLKLFNVFTAVLIFMALWVIWISEDSRVLFPAFSFLGTLFLFCYVNPQTPWRFLFDLIFMGMVFIVYSIRTEAEPKISEK